ncbi:odorant receptor 94b-like [Bradysia coprophila]|uniref:odorant receptor 94b-like n=1 Tax=Bradysia coprophila TaxID=38358 RepID=UPI00187DB308|nr:odorant receptor 94b-like [Bradysia coprophila]
MHSIQIHKFIALIISFLYLIGVWHRGDKSTVKEMQRKLFFCIQNSLFVLSIGFGSIANDKKNMSIFLAEISVGAAVLSVKLWLLVWKQNKILDLLPQVCVFSIRNGDDYKRSSDKLRGFVKFALVFISAAAFAAFLSTLGLPLFGSEKTIFMEIAFPLDYRNKEIAFWIAITFMFIGTSLSVVSLLFTVMCWYLLLSCSLRYEVLGSELKNLGRITKNVNEEVPAKQMHNRFFEDLKASIDTYPHSGKLTNDVESFFSDLFFIQLGTSGLCICNSVYCLAFNIGGNSFERLLYFLVFFYFISDLFIITYFGNEIMLSSNRLSYCLFESDWYNQPQSTKKCVVIFGEHLKQPQQLVICKLYPLTLETFTRILNSAYSMFNILKSFQ